MNLMEDQQGRLCIIPDYSFKDRLKEGYKFLQQLGDMKYLNCHRCSDGRFIGDYISVQEKLLKAAQKEVKKREQIIRELQSLKNR